MPSNSTKNNISSSLYYSSLPQIETIRNFTTVQCAGTQIEKVDDLKQNVLNVIQYKLKTNAVS